MLLRVPLGMAGQIKIVVLLDCPAGRQFRRLALILLPEENEGKKSTARTGIWGGGRGKAVFWTQRAFLSSTGDVDLHQMVASTPCQVPPAEICKCAPRAHCALD